MKREKDPPRATTKAVAALAKDLRKHLPAKRKKRKTIKLLDNQSFKATIYGPRSPILDDPVIRNIENEAIREIKHQTDGATESEKLRGVLDTLLNAVNGIALLEKSHPSFENKLKFLLITAISSASTLGRIVYREKQDRNQVLGGKLRAEKLQLVQRRSLMVHPSP